MEEDKNISVDSAKIGGDLTAWTVDNTRISVGQNTAQCIDIGDLSSVLTTSNNSDDCKIYNSAPNFHLLTDYLDRYINLSPNLIFRNAYGWKEPGYWVGDRLKELIAEYPDWEITEDNTLSSSPHGADVFMVVQDPSKKAKYNQYAVRSFAKDESIAITYILDMLIVKWHDREWAFTFEKQDKDSFLKDFDRVLKIITSILDHITKRRKENENMKKSLDIIAEGAKYK